jgi:pimeloyl-ACP methyl ester carboxylesterase
MPAPAISDTRQFTEHRVPRGQGKLYARDYPGAGPAFVLMHGFPDHLGIYDDLVPFLVAGGRRVVTFDFLGFGRSDRPAGARYTFEGQVEDLSAVASHLKLGKFVPVVHDSSGPAGINYALAHRDEIAGLVILNSGYDDNFLVLWPEMVTLFATKELGALAQAVAQSTQQFGWLLGWQKSKFSDPQPAAQRDHFNDGVGQLIADNFTKEPSSGPAFMQLASHFFAELARNTKRLPELRDLNVPVKVIWGELDPYITAAVGRDRASHFRKSTFHPLQAGHWLQADVPDLVAKAMLS